MLEIFVKQRDNFRNQRLGWSGIFVVLLVAIISLILTFTDKNDGTSYIILWILQFFVLASCFIVCYTCTVKNNSYIKKQNFEFCFAFGRMISNTNDFSNTTCIFTFFYLILNLILNIVVLTDVNLTPVFLAILLMVYSIISTITFIMIIISFARTHERVKDLEDFIDKNERTKMLEK